MEDFGDADFIVRRLESERAVQFVTWKQEVIDQLLLFIKEEAAETSKGNMLSLGPTSFHHIWEDACKCAFGDVLDTPIGELDMELREDFSDCNHETVKEILPRPRWREREAEDAPEFNKDKVATLIPDVVAIRKGEDGTLEFCIYDAKYYKPSLKANEVKGVPGVGDVTKQLLYQSAYRDFINAHDFGKVRNVFLVPIDEDHERLMGVEDFPGVIDGLGEPFSDVVEMWGLPAEKIWDVYLMGQKTDIKL